MALTTAAEREQSLSGPQQRRRHYSDVVVRASIGRRPSRDDNRVEQVVAEAFFQPEEVSYVGVLDRSSQLDFHSYDAAVSAWGLTSCGVQRLEWYAEVGNVASRRVAEKVGFTIEGTLRSFLLRPGGERVDAWAGSLLSVAEIRR